MTIATNATRGYQDNLDGSQSWRRGGVGCGSTLGTRAHCSGRTWGFVPATWWMSRRAWLTEAGPVTSGWDERGRAPEPQNKTTKVNATELSNVKRSKWLFFLLVFVEVWMGIAPQTHVFECVALLEGVCYCGDGLSGLICLNYAPCGTISFWCL